VKESDLQARSNAMQTVNRPLAKHLIIFFYKKTVRGDLIIFF